MAQTKTRISLIGAQVATAVRSEGLLPGTAEESEPGLQAVHIGTSVVQTAWDTAQLRTATPTPPQLLSTVREILHQTRAMMRGEEVNLPSLVGLTGIVLEADAEVSGSWGLIRRARPSDHPAQVAVRALRELLGHRTELIALASGERSIQLLLDGGTP